jgi:hypothetical protein
MVAVEFGHRFVPVNVTEVPGRGRSSPVRDGAGGMVDVGAAVDEVVLAVVVVVVVVGLVVVVVGSVVGVVVVVVVLVVVVGSTTAVSPASLQAPVAAALFVSPLYAATHR